MIRRALTRAAHAHGGRPLKHGLIAGLVVALLSTGAGASYAYWTASTTTSSTPTVASLVVTPSNFGAFTFSNENVSAAGSSTLVVTSAVQVKNDTVTGSTQAMPLSTTFSRASGGAMFASATSLSVWTVGSLAACTSSTAIPGSGVAAGNWGDGVTISATDLDAGATVYYCLRSSVSRDAAANSNAAGSRNFMPQASATLKAGSAFLATTTATSTGSSSRIYPAATGISNSYWQKVVVNSMCLDVANSGTATGTTVIPWSDCHGNTNQQWQFIPDANNPGFVEIKPRNATPLRVDNGATLTAGAGITVRTDVSTDRQLWQVQSIGGGSTYQIVSKYSGLCLTAPGGSGTQMTQAVCTGAVGQVFTITQLTRVQFPTPTCTIPANRQSLVFAWSEAGTGPYIIQGWAGSYWYTADSSSNANATQLTVPNQNYPSGTYQFRILDGTQTTVATGTVVVSNGGFQSCTAQAAPVS
ncbi:RICIN domain-containing protein [Schumannella sp. 10F1B-5-1]|uniref:RICIN domain-containing protein n=1 Tax=Schumannella sp. 10F1B-5-1 TaxID=2590780 RepID=UPI0011313D49|nr:RICIN domain-containing protein [Schumannella sp. 10F1B-5-1]TPW70031.1 hypothetical protein FJ658_13410 [Schumannella sp. 10F1B-5-1]